LTRVLHYITVESVKEEDDAKGSSKKDSAAAINWNSHFSFTEPGPPPEKPLEGAERIGDKIPMEEFLQKVMKRGD